MSASATDGTIDSTNRHAWSENAGWIDFGSSQGNVHVTDNALTGYAWGENVGWVSLNCTNDSSCGTVSYGVSNTTEGTLAGYAWSENAGWIQFNPTGGGVTIDASGNFAGEAWGENVGWIVFNCSTTNSCGTVSYRVSTDWRPSSTRTPKSSGVPEIQSGIHGGGRSNTQALIDQTASARASRNRVSSASLATSSRPSAASVSSKIPTVPASTFSDTPSNAWFSPYVTEIVELGIASGYKDAEGNPTGLFGPGNDVTEAEILKMAILASGKAIGEGTPRNPSARNDWSAPYVKAAEDLRLSAYAHFLDIRRPATRGEVIQTVLELFGVKIEAAQNPFTDLDSSSPHALAIETAYQLGILSGDTDTAGAPRGAVRPDAPINRVEAAKIIVLARQRLRK